MSRDAGARRLGRKLDGWAATLLLVGCGESTNAAFFDALRHCALEDADETCRARDASRPYCDRCRSASEHRGCAPTLPRDPACVPGAPPGDATETGIETGTAGGGTFATTGIEPPPPVSTGEAACAREGLADAACPVAAPYCLAGACTGCEAAEAGFCADLEPTRPLCDLGSGRCVPCHEASAELACGLEAPRCDPNSGACLGCEAHEHCPGSGCHLHPSDPRFGACVAPNRVYHVDNRAGCPGAGTPDAPYCQLVSAVGRISAGDAAVVHVAGGGPAYTETLAPRASTTVMLVGHGGPVLSRRALHPAPVLSVEEAVVYAQDLAIVGHPSAAGIACARGTLWLDGVEVRDHAGYGVDVSEPCEVVVARSTIHHNAGGGLRQLGGSLRLHDTAVGDNGDGLHGPGLNLQLADVDIRYATLVANRASGNADSMQCLSSTGSVRNSIVLGPQPSSVALGCSALVHANNAHDTASFAGPGGRVVDEPFLAGWFVDPSEGDYRLGAPPLSPFGGVAQWREGDPRFDADGTPRPRETPGYAGIDEP